MEITFVGHSCFKVKGREVTLVFDPYNPDELGMKLPKLSADVVLLSHDHFDHSYISGVSDYSLAIDSPGEYETKDVLIRGLPSFHDDQEGSKRGKNTMYVVEIDGFTVMHLGDLGHTLNEETLEQISNVDVLLIPVGGTYTIDAAMASKVISSIEPGIVIPMHYQIPGQTKISGDLDPIEKFLDEMGLDENIKKMPKLKISSRADIPEETEVVLLDPQS